MSNAARNFDILATS